MPLTTTEPAFSLRRLLVILPAKASNRTVLQQ
jgi:hypothetical protein